MGQEHLTVVEPTEIVVVEPVAEELDWHIAHAQAIEGDVRLVNDCLAQLATVEERFSGRPELAGELRAIAARLRDERNDLADHARALRQAAPRPTRKRRS